MKLDALDHPKTLDFASRLDVTRPTAIGHLELLWAFTAKQAIQGNIGKWPDGAIARACDWMGPADIFVAALVDSRLADRDSTSRLIVHDWADHAPSWVRAKLNKIGLSFVGSVGPTSEATGEPTIEGSSDDTATDLSGDYRNGSGPPQSGLESVLPARASPSLAMPREEKPREGKGDARGKPSRAAPASSVGETANGEGPSGKRRTKRMPADHETEPFRQWARIHAPDVDFDHEVAVLRDHEFRDAHSDWDAVTRNWLRRAQKAARPPQGDAFPRHREFGT